MECFNRNALENLRKWRNSTGRKPLILRGARQVGKTTLVKQFAEEFDVFLHFNLEKEEDRNLFELYDDVNELLRAMFLMKRKPMTTGDVLLFIDEIQNSQKAVAILRYFYEEANFIHVIGAGSLLETLMDVRKISFPVGRVQFMALRPCSFTEFLGALGEDLIRKSLEDIQLPEALHPRMMKLFKEYILCGGMPAAVAQYALDRDVLGLKDIYESLLLSYRDDVEKYTASPSMTKVIRSILSNGWKCAAETISFEGFTGTNYKSREMSEAFQIISKSMVLELAYPTSNVQVPMMTNMRRHPKLLWLDTGLVNYASGIQYDVFSVEDISDVWRGRITEHIVGQELLAISNDVSAQRVFWRSDRVGSEAEVDFVHLYKGKVIPIEVKSGHNAKLKSLHLFMDAAPHDVAVRVWSNRLSIDEVKSAKGKVFRLVNLPYYYVGQLETVLEMVLDHSLRC